MMHDAARPWYRAGYEAWPPGLRIWAGEQGNRTLILTANHEQAQALAYLQLQPPLEFQATHKFFILPGSAW